MIPLYLAFPDGVFRYECAECTALCCRGHGFGGSLKREAQTLITLYPALGSAATHRQGHLISFVSPNSGCFFLDDDNLCRIEKIHGKALKPGVCTLFPFNVFTRIGKAIAVSPHFLCPLRLQIPARPGQGNGAHSFIETGVRESGLLESETLDICYPRFPMHPSLNPAEILAREERFRDVCSEALGQERFADVVRRESGDPVEHDVTLTRAMGVMGIEIPAQPQSRDAVDDLLLALAAPFRLGMLRLSSEEILRALALSEQVLRRVMSLTNDPPSPQGAFQMLNSFNPALRLLARGEEPLEFAKGADVKLTPFGDPGLTFAAYGVLRKAGGPGGVLRALEEVMGSSFAASDRTPFLIKLGAHIENVLLKRSRKGRSARDRRRAAPDGGDLDRA